MESVIKWQTGEPKKVGFYLVSTSKNEILINHVAIGEKGNLIWFAGKNEILAWCPLNEIKPYKE